MHINLEKSVCSKLKHFITITSLQFMAYSANLGNRFITIPGYNTNSKTISFICFSLLEKKRI